MGRERERERDLPKKVKFLVDGAQMKIILIRNTKFTSDLHIAQVHLTHHRQRSRKKY